GMNGWRSPPLPSREGPGMGGGQGYGWVSSTAIVARAATRPSIRSLEGRGARTIAHLLHIMAPAERDIAVVAADFGLGALGDGLAACVDAQVHRRLAAAGADRLDLLQAVRDAEQGCRSFEQLGAEIGTQAIAEHRHVELVTDAGEAEHLA